jgi:hypothetical protein
MLNGRANPVKPARATGKWAEDWGFSRYAAQRKVSRPSVREPTLKWLRAAFLYQSVAMWVGCLCPFRADAIRPYNANQGQTSPTTRAWPLRI